mmetsp:Transcript_44482/g.117628  ORF Transcript_44482/g.117628 Transcript_44482/m.117628 type:complete len:367 (-) Transcript_44482:253-1353(-)
MGGGVGGGRCRGCRCGRDRFRPPQHHIHDLGPRHPKVHHLVKDQGAGTPVAPQQQLRALRKLLIERRREQHRHAGGAHHQHSKLRQTPELAVVHPAYAELRPGHVDLVEQGAEEAAEHAGDGEGGPGGVETHAQRRIVRVHRILQDRAALAQFHHRPQRHDRAEKDADQCRFIEVARRLLHHEQHSRHGGAEGGGNAASAAYGHVVTQYEILVDGLRRLAEPHGDPDDHNGGQRANHRPHEDHGGLRAHGQAAGHGEGGADSANQQVLPGEPVSQVHAVQQRNDGRGSSGRTIRHPEHHPKSGQKHQHCGQPRVYRPGPAHSVALKNLLPDLYPRLRHELRDLLHRHAEHSRDSPDADGSEVLDHG